jgi:hypothetical protein
VKRLVVVDTNVGVVANGRAQQASSNCVLACVEGLERLMNDLERLVIDDQWQILREYARNLTPTGQGGVGSTFLKWVQTNRTNGTRIEQVHITPHPQRIFVEFPDSPQLEAFDRDDRKFVAVAAVHPRRPSILQAVDSRWDSFTNVLRDYGIVVDYLCPEDIERLLSAPERRPRR